jgi:hypothetical protein
MIRFKSIRKVFPNGLTWADYYIEDIVKEDWHSAIMQLIDVMKQDSKDGWQLIFNNLLSSLKSSVFYPVMTSFSDWETNYSLGSDIIKFNSQQSSIIDFYGADIKSGKEPGERIYPAMSGKGSRWLFGHQMPRVKGYSNDNLYEMLYNFALLGKAIPISGWENNLGYGEKIKALCENYTEYLKAAYLLPPSWYLVKKFETRSWLKILTDSGILSDGFLRTGRGFRCNAKDGHECNSLVELEIDNWLFAKGIPHQKEPLYPFHKEYNSSSRLRADFRVQETFIEYAGLMDDPEYASRMEIKKKLAHALKINLIVIEPNNFKNLDDLLQKIRINV